MSNHDIPLACDLTALPDRAHHEKIGAQLMSQALRVTALADGYAVTFPIAALTLAAAFIDGERHCCPFLYFTLLVPPGANEFQVQFTGSADVKAFLSQELLPLLPV